MFPKIILSVICSFSVLFMISPSLSAFADSSEGQQVLDDTRYSAIGFDDVEILIGVLEAMSDNSLDESASDVAKRALDLFAQKAAEAIAENTIDEANKTWGTGPSSYPIQQAFVIMGKRRINYPNGEYEVQTCYLYRDKNSHTVSPQQFGQYTISPNTLFLVRDTSFNGVIACSFPLGEGNNIQLETYNGDSACDVLFYVPDNDTIVYDTASGRETYGFRHGANWRSPELHFENNSTNTIVNNTLVDVYNNNGSSYYNNYFPDYYMDNFEALIGTGYWYEGSQGFMTGIQPFYCTTAFFNSSGEFGSSHINDYFTTNPNDINPSKPPAYILPDNNPFAGGQTITTNNINNYADYGVTEINGELSLSPDVLAGALGGLINPDFQGAVAGVFDAQPQIGFGFDTPLDLNLPDLVGDFIDSIVVRPDVDFDWSEPTFPVITQATAPAVLPDYNLPVVTFPSSAVDTAGQIFDIATDLWQPSGLLNIFLIIALVGLSVYLIF